MNNIKVYHLVAEKQGARLDKYLFESCPGLSRTRAQKLIADGLVTVNEERAKASTRLNIGDRITIQVPPLEPSLLTPEPIPLDIIYEDDDVLVINKPAGLTVHPAPGHPEHTLVNAILHHLPTLTSTGDSGRRPGIVHRLDKDTSGVMLVAKNNQAQANLMSQFKSRQVSKIYLVLVRGHLTPETGVIEAPIGRDPAHRKRMAIVSKGREARTEYRVKEYLDNYTLLEVKPETGRTHQIRVHLSAIGYPVVGDSTYGAKSALVSRQFLHAYRIKFRLPSTGRYVEFTSEPSPDLRQVLQKLHSA
ncbi:MAG: RluA family pseudouridine synthase [Chloroflexi bacterium]|nr:RluA family pseudouridine synthase [Chloroflexota bacterium]